MMDFNFGALKKQAPQCVHCKGPIDPEGNFRRFVQVRGARVNVIRDTGACSQECVDQWWADHSNVEDLIEPCHQTDENGQLVLDEKGNPVPGVEPEDTSIEMRVHDFIARQKNTLVQLHPTLVFESKDHANDWWNTPEDEHEKTEREAAKAGKVDHIETERLMYEVKDEKVESRVLKSRR